MANGIKKQTYYKNGDGFVLNVYCKDGEKIELFEKQAKYMLAPLGTELRKTKEKPVKQKAASVKQLPLAVKEKPQSGKQAGK